MLNGLDCCSGIGGLTRALKDWVRPVAYCEVSRFAQAVPLSRMVDGRLPPAPIWDDITSLKGAMLPTPIDIIYGGTPCQDISVVGPRIGLEGKRSGLITHVFRLVEEIRPAYVFLENVPGIRTRGLSTILERLSDLRYDCRWTSVSAAKDGSCSPTSTHKPYGRLSLKAMAYLGMLPTPCASEAGRDGKNRKYGDGTLTLSGKLGGRLNPQFVEKMMLFPIGWTELPAWATLWFRNKPKKPLKD